MTNKKLALVAFLHGLILAFGVSTYLDYRYEKELYESMAQRFKDPQGNNRKTFENLVQGTFDIQFYLAKKIALTEDEISPIFLFRSGDKQLLDGIGACGNYSHVLAELCQAAGFESRIVQLMRNYQFGSHIIVEAKVDGRWAAADALYKIIYYNQDSSLASLEQVQAQGLNLTQIPKGYPYSSDYSNYRYTNWQKIPFLMPMLRRFLVAIKGDAWVSTLCLRSYFLNFHQFNLVVFSIMYVILMVITVLIALKRI
ncbi:MAG: hypothetical protein EBX50_15240 [Chitinophagia bacterium]|nr:hypothetical protein [Chitinophagia bacterium]